MVVQRTSVGLDVHARSVVASALDGDTGEISEQRLTPAHADVAVWIGGLPGPVKVSASGLAVGDPAAAAPGTAGVAHGDSGHRVWTKVLDAPAGAYPSEPHLASIRATHGACSSSPSSRRRAAL